MQKVLECKISTHGLLETKVCPEEGERHRDAEPQGQYGHQGAKGHRCRRAFTPQDQVHHKEVSKHHPERHRPEWGTVDWLAESPSDHWVAISSTLNATLLDVSTSRSSLTQGRGTTSAGRWSSTSLLRKLMLENAGVNSNRRIEKKQQ